MADFLSESFSPLCEKSVRADGTVGIKLIGPGWGSGGYYSEAVLQRDIPRAFPAGTHMYWNHPTATEETERPEGDLNNLAAVLVSEPRWEPNGLRGAGMYADAKVFTGYAEAVDQIGDHIGVSIRGYGSKAAGEAEGKTGLIVQEISGGRSVDFVTKPGAGGAVLSIFESAPGAGKLPDIKEAHNLGEWLESKLHLSLTQLGDGMFGDGNVNREERKAMSAAIGAALDAYRASLIASTPQLYQRSAWGAAPDSEDVAALGNDDMSESQQRAAADNPNMEDAMSDELQQQLAESQRENARLREMLLLNEAKEFAIGALAAADLPDVTKTRLQRQLVANPPVKEGKIDQDAYKARVETAVNEARTEIAAVLGDSGQIRGQGASDQPAAVPVAEAQKRLDRAFELLNGGTVRG